MKSPSAIVHAVCGSPRLDSCVEHIGSCWLCAGAMTRGESVDSWNGASFTGQNRVRLQLATHVCESCVFVTSRLSPVPGRPAKDGKKFGGNFRNYSSLWERGWESPIFAPERDSSGRIIGYNGPAGLSYVNASKADKDYVRSFLAREHGGVWFAALADSGQKHVIPWAPMNGPGRGGVVLFDEQLVQVPDSLALVDEMTLLLTAGATKEELGSGDYSARAWQMCGAMLRAFDETHGQHRGGGWFTLALWLAQRDEETVQARMAAEKETKSADRKRKGKAANPHDRGAPRAPRRVSGNAKRERAEALGPVADTNAERGANVRDPGGVGDDNSAQAPSGDTEGKQLSMFGRPR